MKNTLFFSSLCICVLFLLPVCFASDGHKLDNKISSELTTKGFENVIVTCREKLIIASYENRIYRNESDAAASVIQTILEYSSSEEIILIPQYRKTPMLCIVVDKEIHNSIKNETASGVLSNLIKVNLDVKSFWHQIKDYPSANNPDLKVDLIMHPQLKTRFGNFNKIAETQINIAPEAKVSLWKGLSLSGQLILPLHNDLDSIGNYIRPGIVSINQLIRLPYNTFASGSIGYFTQNRYGVDLELRNYVINGRISFVTSLGYTSEAFFQKGIWYYNSQKKIFTHQTSVNYRNPDFDLNMKLSYGKFFAGDKGWRFDISRQFGETEIGFYVTRTNSGNNGGLNFSIPIFPSKYWKINSVRLRPTENFAWEYRYVLNDETRTYDTGNKMDYLFKKYNPDYIKKELIKSLIKN